MGQAAPLTLLLFSQAKDLPTFKDNDFLNEGQKLHVGEESKKNFLEKLKRDVEVLTNLVSNLVEQNPSFLQSRSLLKKKLKSLLSKSSGQKEGRRFLQRGSVSAPDAGADERPVWGQFVPAFLICPTPPQTPLQASFLVVPAAEASGHQSGRKPASEAHQPCLSLAPVLHGPTAFCGGAPLLRTGLQ